MVFYIERNNSHAILTGLVFTRAIRLAFIPFLIVFLSFATVTTLILLDEPDAYI